MSTDKTSVRQKAAAAKAEQERQEKKDKMVRWGGIIIVVILVLGIIVGAVLASRKPQAEPLPTPSSVTLPTGVTAEGYTMGTVRAGVPNVTVWEDFQCPGCQLFSEKYGQTLETWVKEGKITLTFRPAMFLDQRFPESKNSSARATAALGCAIDAGKGPEYILAVYAAQPIQEGEGYTESTLLGLGQQVGLTGATLDTFTNCVKSGKYLSWPAASEKAFEAANIPTTPTILVNGKTIQAASAPTADALYAMITNANK